MSNISVLEKKFLLKFSLLLNFTTKYLKKKHEISVKESINIQGEAFHFPYVHKMTTSLIDCRSIGRYIKQENSIGQELYKTMEELSEIVLGKELLSELKPSMKCRKWELLRKKTNWGRGS
ncbi:hypothetical protein V1503_24685 [Bacillus sp. SCS-151]|uniref:hypothetical protein n=1 Tax=Nanhaiella sioensis TaxID=3115293 RepID=UPI00397A4728